MSQVETLINQILEHGQNNADDSLKVIPQLQPWQHTSQGDVDFVLLPSRPERVAKASPVSQLAPGTSKGSRHCIRLEDVAKIQFWKLPNPNPLQGLILEFAEPIVIEHPEHGDQQLHAGVWFVKFQRRHADEVKRIAD